MVSQADIVMDRVQGQTLYTHKGKFFGTIPTTISITGTPEEFNTVCGETENFRSQNTRWVLKLSEAEIIGGVYLTKIMDSQVEINPVDYDDKDEDEDEDDDEDDGQNFRQLYYKGRSQIGLTYNMSVGIKKTIATLFEHNQALFALDNVWLGITPQASAPNVIIPNQSTLKVSVRKATAAANADDRGDEDEDDDEDGPSEDDLAEPITDEDRDVIKKAKKSTKAK